MFEQKHLVYLALIIYLGQFCHSLSIRTSTYHPVRFPRQVNTCKNNPFLTNLFQCTTSPACIDTDLLCNGQDDCPDGSDEKKTICKSIECPGYLFQCTYGACIDMDLKCNGVKNCKDNSDEENCPIENRVNTNCRSDQFECNNGQCIDTDGRCNGIVDCSDRSDETEETCLNTECPGYTYKCNYGACVDGDAECNGVKNCADNSDEQNCGPTTKSPPVVDPPDNSRNKCITPAQPSHGSWMYFLNDAIPAIANVAVAPKTQLQFRCNEMFKLSTTIRDDETLHCREDGQWSLTVFPECLRLCPKLYNKDQVTITCTLDGSIIPCDKATVNAELTYKCTGYYEPDGHSGVNVCGKNGNWYYPEPRCKPKCGEKRVSVQTLVVGGHEVESGNYPWMAAIYSDRLSSPVFRNICGGTLLSTAIVLTAAHCVSNDHDGTLIKSKYFQVAAGKYYNKFQDDRDKAIAEYSRVSLIVKHEDYQGPIQNFRADIALLKLKTPFHMTKVIQPICFSFTERIEALLIEAKLTVTGWGFTQSHGVVSDTLKEIDLPYVDNEQCRSELDPDFARKYLISDKLCAGYVNQNMSVCKGDSGGGLVASNKEGRYYIQGVVSLAHSIEINNQLNCNVQKRALFTNVFKYGSWIDRMFQQLTINN